MWTKLIRKLTLKDLPADRAKKIKQRIKLITIISVEFIAIITVILLIFLAGKKSHTVTFDLNGGILISGDVEQTVMQGQNATPPNVAKHGHYLRGWTGSYRSVTQDITVKAIWEYNTSPGVEYSVPSNTNYCEISGCFKDIQGELFIGSYYNDRPVLGIKEGSFKNMTGITAIHLLDGILTIKAEAFSGCTSLEVFDMPGTIVRIGNEAFKDCRSLKSITLPDTLQIIEAGAFAGCESLTEIVIPDSVHTIEAGAFEGCVSLEKVTLSNSIKVIEKDTFEHCESLKEIIIPEGVEVIEDMAFAGCTSLEKVIFKGDAAFMAANPLEEDAVEGEEAEDDKKNDKKEDNEDSDEDSDSENEDTEKEEETLPVGVTKIGTGTFAGCKSLKEIVIPATVTEIGEMAFTTSGMKVKLYVSEDKIPEGYVEGWHTDKVVVVFDYDPTLPEVEDELPDEGEGEPEDGDPGENDPSEDEDNPAPGEDEGDSWIDDWIDKKDEEDEKAEGDGTEGDGTEGDGTEGDGTEGDGTEGDGTEGDGTEGGDAAGDEQDDSRGDTV